MSIAVNNTASTYAAASNDTAAKTQAAAKETTTESTQDSAAVYEKSEATSKSSTSQIYNRDSIVSKLKADQQARMASMQSLVENLLGKQKGTFDLANAKNLANTFSQAAAFASPADIAKAQQDISEDGYWGVEQTSDRLVSMAIALSGGDTSKADQMIEAINKGFKKATAAWGRDLPQISQDTLDATLQKMEDWKNGLTTAEDYSKYLS